MESSKHDDFEFLKAGGLYSFESGGTLWWISRRGWGFLTLASMGAGRDGSFSSSLLVDVGGRRSFSLNGELRDGSIDDRCLEDGISQGGGPCPGVGAVGSFLRQTLNHAMVAVWREARDCCQHHGIQIRCQTILPCKSKGQHPDPARERKYHALTNFQREEMPRIFG